MREWLIRFLLALDQLIQACMGHGLPGQTISARAGKAAKRGKKWGCILCTMLDWVDTNHCEGAIKNDIKRAQAVLDDLKGYDE